MSRPIEAIGTGAAIFSAAVGYVAVQNSLVILWRVAALSALEAFAILWFAVFGTPALKSLWKLRLDYGSLSLAAAGASAMVRVWLRQAGTRDQRPFVEMNIPVLVPAIYDNGLSIFSEDEFVREIQAIISYCFARGHRTVPPLVGFLVLFEYNSKIARPTSIPSQS
jgi:hypothetical protein